MQRAPSSKLPAEPVAAGALVLRFLLELGTLASVGYAVAQFRPGTAGLLLGFVAVAVIALVWGVFVSPRAPRRLADPGRLALELGFFGLAPLGLYLVGFLSLAVSFGLLVLVDEAVLLRRGLR